MPKGKLLVVDDEESVAITMGAILEMDGYDVDTVTNGSAALARLRRETFDLVLTDLRLDDMDGLTIIGEVQRLSPDTVSIILTGYASLESAIKALREGAYDYLIKPCDVEELRLVVARGLERRHLALQLKARVEDLERANATIGSLNADLQRRVDQATAALQERMLELSRANDEIASLYHAAQHNLEQLQELDRLKSRFLSMASHELKTPLTSISGLAQVLLRRMSRRLEVGWPTQDEWQQEQHAHVERLALLTAQTGRLGRLIDELLDVSRIESGKLDFRYGEVDLNQLARDVAHRMQLTTTQHAIVVIAENEAGAQIAADRDHLEQVLDNLISNAIKYSPEGGRIEVQVADRDEEMMISVRDEGVGIPPGKVEAVFGLFYQAEDPVSRRGGGMGLGLYISKEIIERHGGRIWAESEPGVGTTVYVVLPRERSSAAA